MIDVLDPIDITLDPAVHCPDLLYTVRRLVCPDCRNQPQDPLWTGSGWAIPWPHKPDCPELAKGPQPIKPAFTLGATA